MFPHPTPESFCPKMRSGADPRAPPTPSRRPSCRGGWRHALMSPRPTPGCFYHPARSPPYPFIPTSDRTLPVWLSSDFSLAHAAPLLHTSIDPFQQPLARRDPHQIVLSGAVASGEDLRTFARRHLHSQLAAVVTADEATLPHRQSTQIIFFICAQSPLMLARCPAPKPDRIPRLKIIT